MAGFFIVLEGPDGVGKTTQARLLAAWLRETGREVVECREPGGTILGEMVREILKGRIPATPEGAPVPIHPRTELLLFASARAQLVEHVIRPALARGAVVVSDRFTMSTHVYQEIIGGIGGVDVDDVIHVATRGLGADLTILLDASPGRLAVRGGPDDRIEARCRGREAELRDAYAVAAGWQEGSGRRVARVDADDPITEVRDRIRAVVSEALGLPGTGHAGPGPAAR